MKTARLLAVDLGASGGKCFAGFIEGGVFRMQEVHRFSHAGIPCYARDRAGQATERIYWDDLFLYSQVLEGLHRYRREVGPHLHAVGIDTWGADGALVTPDGDMLGRIYCYRDHRLDRMIEAVKARIDARRMYRITGIHFQPFNVSNQLHWVALHRPDLLKPGVRFLPIPSVFYYYLGGACQVDSSWASVTQLMDAQSRQWSREILQRLDIPPEVMPEIVPPGTVVGELWPELARAVGLTRAKLVAVGSHDTASAFAAAPVEDTDQALIISSGTWSLVGKLVADPVTSDAALAVNLSNEGGIGNVRLLKNCMGTWLVQELRRVWRQADGRELSWEEITSMAEQAPPFATLINPDDPAFYNPADMETAMAEFCRRTGQAVPAGRGACVRAVYESLALQYRRVHEQISGVCGGPCRVAHVVGGGSRNRLLNQFAANALGLPLLAGPEEATAAGNFIVQALGLGAIGSLREGQTLVRCAFPPQEYRPEGRPAWEQAYARFLELPCS